jgi:hypothetical protein
MRRPPPKRTAAPAPSATMHPAPSGATSRPAPVVAARVPTVPTPTLASLPQPPAWRLRASLLGAPGDPPTLALELLEKWGNGVSPREVQAGSIAFPAETLGALFSALTELGEPLRQATAASSPSAIRAEIARLRAEIAATTAQIEKARAA